MRAFPANSISMAGAAAHIPMAIPCTTLLTHACRHDGGLRWFESSWPRFAEGIEATVPAGDCRCDFGGEESRGLARRAHATILRPLMGRPARIVRWRSDAGNGEAAARAGRISCVIEVLHHCSAAEGMTYPSPSQFPVLHGCGIPRGLVSFTLCEAPDIGHLRPSLQRRRRGDQHRGQPGVRLINRAC